MTLDVVSLNYRIQNQFDKLLGDFVLSIILLE